MKNNHFEQIKKEYMSTHIPERLDFVVNKAIKESKDKMNKKNRISKAVILAASTAATVAILAVGVNTSAVFAQTLSKVPIVSSIVEVLTFREFTVDQDRFQADIKVPQIQGLENEELQNSLNEKYLEENKKLYDEFIKDIEEMEKLGGGHLGLDSGYEIKTDNDDILSICRYYVNTAGSSSTKFQYDTIDKKKQILITLPSLFKDDSYVEVISENIISQMEEQIKTEEGKSYWIASQVEDDFLTEVFEKISKEQNFYINPEGKLVISFDKYEVAAGYMGTPEFIIPTNLIADILVSNEYIK